MPTELNPPLQVERLVSTRRGDPERGPALWLNSREAGMRLLLEGELAWVYGPRRHELATVHIDDSLPKGKVVLRDVAGASTSEIVKIVKPDLDFDRGRGIFA